MSGGGGGKPGGGIFFDDCLQTRKCSHNINHSYNNPINNEGDKMKEQDYTELLTLLKLFRITIESDKCEARERSLENLLYSFQVTMNKLKEIK